MEMCHSISTLVNFTVVAPHVSFRCQPLHFLTLMCNVEVTIKDLLGTTYRYTQSIITEEKSKEGIAQAGNALKEVSRNNSERQDEVQATQVQSSGNWVISGILDWDDVLAVPLVLFRKVPF